MEGFFLSNDDDDDNDFGKYLDSITGNPRARPIQIVLSLSLGVTAFLTFCVLRPRWTALYNARKKQKHAATTLPDLPRSMFGWILPLWRITDQQILASAGLDAYAFLSFFKMAMKFLVVSLFFSLVVIKPVHDAHPPQNPGKKRPHPGDGSNNSTLYDFRPTMTGSDDDDGTGRKNPFENYFQTDYLWIYVVFAYLFSAFAVYLMISTTRRIIEVRQEYLGAQSSLTDRTIRLSGIPPELRSEDTLKEFIESLNIGTVEAVMLCRNWEELDTAMNERMDILRRLEESYTIYLGRRRVGPSSQQSSVHPGTASLPRGTEDEIEPSDLTSADSDPRATPNVRARPKTSIRYGFMKMRSQKVDAIDHYEEKLRQADERVRALRKKEFTATSLAFVTMDSVASCQMAIQAVLDPSPLQLIASQSPSPTDIIWANTYLSHRNRMIRKWSITALILFLALIWVSVFLAIAGLLSVQSIGKVFPQLKKFLKSHETLRTLVVAQLPVLITSLLVALVPYLYYWLSWYQGFMSQRDVELSAISKNFFFVFFNFFVVFTLLGTGFKAFAVFDSLGKALKRDLWTIMNVMADSLQRTVDFYVNFILLQGLGLSPFRLLEMGSVSLYPLFRMGAKTPRDYAELVQPPMFIYGFYLPSALLIYIVCIVYSSLRDSWQILLAGLFYFSIGHFVYKYQLLYAMDNQQHATGRAWVMICDRIFIGLIFFQLTTMGQLALNQAVARTVIMIPLVVATVWISISFSKTYKPLMKFIALRSVKQGEPYADEEADMPDVESTTSNDLAPERRAWAETDDSQHTEQRSTLNGSHEATHGGSTKGIRFINPSLVAPLHPVWIADRNFRRLVPGEVNSGDESV